MLLNRSSVGKTWDWIIVLTSLFASAWYVANTYTNQSWKAVMNYKAADIVFTSIYVTDAIISWLLAPSPMRYAMSIERILDIGTLVPYFIDVSYSYDANRVRETRVLRLLRFLRISRGLKNQHGARRQIYQIFYFILCLLFVGAGMIQLMENDVRQAFQYHCKYSTAATNWIASCSPDLPFSAYENPLNPDFWCDCKNWDCHTYYLFFDKPKQPTAVQCVRLTFFDTLYFMVVTVATLGYGDIAPSTELSRMVIPHPLHPYYNSLNPSYPPSIPSSFLVGNHGCHYHEHYFYSHASTTPSTDLLHVVNISSALCTCPFGRKTCHYLWSCR